MEKRKIGDKRGGGEILNLVKDPGSQAALGLGRAMAKPRTSRLWFVTLAEVDPRERKYGYENGKD
jgi:hypothetical protein